MAFQVPTQFRHFVPEIQALTKGGMGADRAYETIRSRLGIVKGKPSPLPRQVVRAITREIRTGQLFQADLFPQKRSERFRQAMAIGTDFSSPLGYRYLLDYEFTVTNTLTGKTEKRINTIGFRSLDRMGAFMNQAQDRLDQFNTMSDERYLAQFEVADRESVRFVGLYRTLNK